MQRTKAHKELKRTTGKLYKLFLLTKKASCPSEERGHRRLLCLPRLLRHAVQWGTPQHGREGEGTPDSEANGNHACIFYRASAGRERNVASDIFNPLTRTATGEFSTLLKDKEAGLLPTQETREQGLGIVNPDGDSMGADNLLATTAAFQVISKKTAKVKMILLGRHLISPFQRGALRACARQSRS